MGTPVMLAAMPVDEHMSRWRRFRHALHMPMALLPWLGTCALAHKLDTAVCMASYRVASSCTALQYLSNKQPCPTGTFG